MATSLLEEEVADITTCSICFEDFNSPRALPCLHTFCLGCLQGHCKDKLPGSAAKCPLCREKFKIPEKGLEGLQVNFFLQKLIDSKQKSKISGKVLIWFPAVYFVGSSAGKRKLRAIYPWQTASYLKVNGKGSCMPAYSFSRDSHLATTGRHLPQCLPATRHKWTRLTKPGRLVLDLPTPDGWKAELTYRRGLYTPRWQTVTNPSSFPARCRITIRRSKPTHQLPLHRAATSVGLLTAWHLGQNS